MKRTNSLIAFVLVLCTLVSMFSMLAPTASAATVKISIADILIGGKNLVNSIENNKKLPSAVSCNGTKVTCEQFLYLASKAVVMLNDGKSTSTKITVKEYGKCPNPSETLSSTFKMQKSEYVSLAKKIYKWMDTNGRALNYVTSSKGKLRYENYLYTMARVLLFARSKNRLPNYVVTRKWSNVVGTIAAERAAAKAMYPEYLKATEDCQVTHSTIKAVSREAIGDAKTLRQAAKNLVKYLNEQTRYEPYRNTIKGAVEVWNTKKGNCCDMAHLVIACARAQGIPARYVHAKCRFSDGHIDGHVYAELWTGEKWEIADIVNDANYLGYKNNTDIEFIKRYIALTF